MSWKMVGLLGMMHSGRGGFGSGRSTARYRLLTSLKLEAFVAYMSLGCNRRAGQLLSSSLSILQSGVQYLQYLFTLSICQEDPDRCLAYIL